MRVTTGWDGNITEATSGRGKLAAFRSRDPVPGHWAAGGGAVRGAPRPRQPR